MTAVITRAFEFLPFASSPGERITMKTKSVFNVMALLVVLAMVMTSRLAPTQRRRPAQPTAAPAQPTLPQPRRKPQRPTKAPRTHQSACARPRRQSRTQFVFAHTGRFAPWMPR